MCLLKWQPNQGGGLIDDYKESRGGYLQSETERKAIQTKIIQTEVKNGLEAARRILSTNSTKAIQDLKILHKSVELAPELDSDIRGQLMAQISDTIRFSEQQAEFEAIRRINEEEQRAKQQEQKRLTDALLRKEETVSHLMERFDALMDERRFIKAEDDVGAQISLLIPERTITTSAIQSARLSHHITEEARIQDIREKNYALVIRSVHEASIPFPDEPPIIYPEPSVWEDLTRRRAKYASVDLANQGSAEQSIFQALDDDTSLQFLDSPLEEVVLFLEDQHDIQIELDTRALDDVGIGTDVPISKNLKGISLRSALRLMLRDLDLTYVIRDEVLLITTPEEAESKLITKVYPVGDLVLPIQSSSLNPFALGGGLGQGNGFGGGGGGGGGFGGGGGGFGGGGGGFGGGGFGGGGQGGFFDVESPLTLGAKKNANQTQPVASEPTTTIKQQAKASVEAIKLDTASNDSDLSGWDMFFQANLPKDDAEYVTLAAQVRETARALRRKKDFVQMEAMIRAALKNGQQQNWMYEVLAISMMANGKSGDELERTLMSAVDFVSSPEELLHIALYMEQTGFDKRAFQILTDVAELQPLRPEPYVKGLQIARRLNDTDAIMWACAGVLSQPWPQHEEHVETMARREAEATLLALNNQGDSPTVSKFESTLKDSAVRDCIVKVTWTGDADIDVFVEEPAGTVCSFESPRTTAGGVLLGDSYSSATKKSVNGVTESYVCAKGYSGVYRVLLRKVWGDVTAGKATVDIYTNYGGENEKHIRQQVDLGKKDAMLLFDVVDGRPQTTVRRSPCCHHCSKPGSHESCDSGSATKQPWK